MENHVRKSGGKWVGFLSYDLGRLFENLPHTAMNDLDLPLASFAWFPDNPTPLQIPPRDNNAAQPDLRWNFTPDNYQGAVQKALQYIRDGDIFQVNLSQRAAIANPGQPLDFFINITRQTPAAYGALLDFGNYAIVSNSPELFFEVDEHRNIITCPIKGTRPRGEGMELELLNSEKDQAELNMIIDLERNDLGKICKIGSVIVVNKRELKLHPTLIHAHAKIAGKLNHGVGFVRMLQALFPGGSVTGAPKIRAMEIIEEIEGVRRGPYCGAIGVIDSSGKMLFNLAIRTVVFKNRTAYAHFGGGIVADSNPRGEYLETLVKSRAILQSFKVTNQLFDI